MPRRRDADGLHDRPAVARAGSGGDKHHDRAHVLGQSERVRPGGHVHRHRLGGRRIGYADRQRQLPGRRQRGWQHNAEQRRHELLHFGLAAAGSHSVTANYAGNGSFNASSSAALTQVINASGTTTTLTATPNPSALGQPVTFTATVSANAPGSATPTGSVGFLVDGSPIGEATLSNGVATFTTLNLAAGSHSVTANYAGNGNFNSSSASLTQVVGPRLVDSHDFNGDGKSDILWRNTSNTVAVWLMNGGAVAQAAVLGTVPSSYSIIGQHDFDGDGKADVLWRDASGNISMWLMNGAAVSSAAAVGNLTSNWTLHGTADLNGDGKGDLLWRDSTTGTVAVWFMNGATVASTANFGALPSTWSILGDANGSILWRDSAGDIALWGVQSGQVTSSSGLGTVTSNFVVQGGGDFDGDGKIDILWRDTNSGALSIWFTNGTQVTSAAVVGTLPSNWSIVQVGDYNGDGKSDILLLDAAGDLAVWEMNGAAVSSSLGIGNVGSTWQVQNVNAN